LDSRWWIRSEADHAGRPRSGDRQQIFRPIGNFELTEVGGKSSRGAPRWSWPLARPPRWFRHLANVPHPSGGGPHGTVTWAIEQGAVGAYRCWGLPSAARITPSCSPSQFTYFQGGGFDLALLSFLQIDRQGNVNVSKLGAKPYLTAGCGGFVDITTHARKLVFSGFFTAGAKLKAADGRLIILEEGKSRKLVESVEQVTFSARMAVARGQRVRYVTERCVMDLTPRGLTLREIAPGVNLEHDVLAQAGCPLAIAPDLKTMDERLFRDAPLGLQLPEKTDV
jgi:acyl CoA:acetate/3-ketoacid CoA transferase